MRLQPLAGLERKGLHIERWAVHKGLGRAHGVDAGQKTTDPFEHFKIVQLRRAATAQGTDRKFKPGT